MLLVFITTEDESKPFFIIRQVFKQAQIGSDQLYPL